MQEVIMFKWISYDIETKEEIEMALCTTKFTYKGIDTNGEHWSDTREVYRIASHIILDVYDGNGNEFVFRILDEEFARNQDEIIIDEDSYDLHIKTVGGYIGGFNIDFIEQNQELLVSDAFIKAIESLANKN